MQKRRFLDPSLWALIGINIYLVYHYYQHPEAFTTLIWLYWCQSVLLGLFNFLDMLTVRTIAVQDPAKSSSFGRGSAFFFLFHYGFFHVVYLVFVASMKRTGPIDWHLFKFFLLAFVAGQVITFIQHKIQQRTEKSDLGKMFFLPYLRILPMHLTILVPAFLHISNMGIFLVLKSLADVGMYLATRASSKTSALSNSAAATQQSMTNI